MARLERARQRIGEVFHQRCFWLFVALALLVALAPLLSVSMRGRIAANLINVLVLVTALATLSRSLFPFLLALLLAAPTFALQILGLVTADPDHLAMSWGFGAAFYLITLGYLLAYVFRREVMSADKLYGAASAYLMIGVIWAYLFRIVDYLFPGSYTSTTPGQEMEIGAFIYMSFGLLSSNGPGDIAPMQPLAKSLSTLAQITGVLYVAILIARLAGIYPPTEKQ